MIAHDQRWTGAIERFEEAELEVSADLGVLTVGGNRMTVRPDGYRVVIELPGHDIRGELDFTSMSRPFAVNNQPVGDGRVSWLFVPRLRADGWLRIGRQEIRFEGNVAYHDHNWGRFRWGGDFSWTWGAILPSGPDDPWSLVFQQMTDRRRLRCLYQALWVWRHDEPAAIFPPAAVQTRFARPARPRRRLHPAAPDAAATRRRGVGRTAKGSRSPRRGRATRCTPNLDRSRTPASRSLVRFAWIDQSCCAKATAPLA